MKNMLSAHWEIWISIWRVLTNWVARCNSCTSDHSEFFTHGRFITYVLLGFMVLIPIGCSNIDQKNDLLPETEQILGQRDEFDAERAFRDVEFQIDLGPRVPGSESHQRAVEWMQVQLRSAGWQTEVQEVKYGDHRIRNVIGKYGQGQPWVILGAHYDSRIYADQDSDPTERSKPVPGANDGASGVAVLLELARIIPTYIDEDAGQIWLVFFDAEDNGNIPSWEWIMGSRAFVRELDGVPDYAVVVDMIGDASLNVYMEKYSNQELTNQIWIEAQKLGYSDHLLPEYRYAILDDHVPFLEAGIPAITIIDFDYPYYHTSEDTLDKISGQSLKVIGDTLLEWLKTNY